MADAGTPSGTEGFREGLRRVGDDAGRMKENLTGMGRDIADTARHGVAAAKEGMSRGIQHAKDQGSELADTISEQVSMRPLTSLAIAAGVGLVVGMLISRPRA